MVLELTPAQKKIVQSKARFRVVNCGRRFGKTTLAILELVGAAVADNDRRVAYIANTYQQARDIAWRELKELTRTIAKEINETRLEIEVYTQNGGTSLIWLRGWESVDTLRGQRFNFLVIDEVAMMRNFEENWQEVLRPTLTDFKGEVLFLSTPKGYNHWYDLYETAKTDSDYAAFKFTSYDNPLLPQEEIDKAKQELTSDRFAQEYLADFRKVEGLVYPEFSREHNVVEVVPTHRVERILAVDFGYTNPAAILTIDLDDKGTYWVVQEYYRSGKVNIELIEYAKSQLSNAVYPDPAEPDRCEEMKRHGLNVREVSKDTPAGINKIRELFKAHRIKIHNSCKNLINELETYRYPDKKDDKNPYEVPIKENDHAVDALRYALSMHTKASSMNSFTVHRPQWSGYNRRG